MRMLLRQVGVWLLSGVGLGLGAASSGTSATLEVEIRPQFSSAPLVFDSFTNHTGSAQVISVTRLDFLLSNFALRPADGTWLGLTNWQAYISAREGRATFRLEHIPAGRYEAARFLVGLIPEINWGDPAQYPPEHPLNPNVNGLHWGWQGGYVFLALEGDWLDGELRRGFSFHIANDPQLMSVELPLELEINSDQSLRLAFDVGKCFASPNPIQLTEACSTSHSRTHDTLAAQLRQNVERAWSVIGLASATVGKTDSPGKGRSTLVVASNATPYRLTISAVFPRPSLPTDNPLTEEGVELGRALFQDERLSSKNRQSCRSCHDLTRAAGADAGRAFSLGAEGQPGARNAMPLFNLAWKNSFFWDGRAASLRAQVLQPIQNPVEMHESLTNVVAKLRAPGAAEHDYPRLFLRAFGTSEINPDRIARALEQFLLTQTAHDSKFDRMLEGEETFTAQEQRGFELFHTEYDPRREQFGADCFHCHGGLLFQSVAFANNGLDREFKDRGRAEVTRREGDVGKFAVPSLRNAAVTGPYMHDGRFQTLDQVLEHYTSGVKRSATLDPNLAKHPDGGVPLSAEDRQALLAFLRTLTDQKYLANTNLNATLASNHN